MSSIDPQPVEAGYSKRASLLPFVTAIAFSELILGAAGMIVSMVFLSSTDMKDVISGAAGFVAGAVLLAAGTVSFAVLELTRPDHGR